MHLISRVFNPLTKKIYDIKILTTLMRSCLSSVCAIHTIYVVELASHVVS